MYDTLVIVLVSPAQKEAAFSRLQPFSWMQTRPNNGPCFGEIGNRGKVQVRQRHARRRLHVGGRSENSARQDCHLRTEMDESVVVHLACEFCRLARV